MADQRHPVPVDRMVLGHPVDQRTGGLPVLETARPAAAIADLAVIDIERRHALLLPAGRQRRHIGGVGHALLPATAMPDHRQREWAVTCGKAQFGIVARALTEAEHGVRL